MLHSNDDLESPYVGTPFTARVWPSGSGAMWLPSRFKTEGDAAEADVLLGLTNVAKFNTEDESENLNKNSVKRGLNGITPYGQKLVSSACLVMEEQYSVGRLSFVTLTLPGRAEDTAAVARVWPAVMNHLLVTLRRLLTGVGLPDDIIGVVEIQPKRVQREGGMPLHLHLVIVGRVSLKKGWQVTPDMVRRIWTAVITSKVPQLATRSFNASVDMEPIRRSTAGYVSKYLSKGIEPLTESQRSNQAITSLIPNTWYICTRDLKDRVMSSVQEGSEVALIVQSMSESKLPERWFSWHGWVPIKSDIGAVVGEVFCFHVTKAGAARLGLLPHQLVIDRWARL